MVTAIGKLCQHITDATNIDIIMTERSGFLFDGRQFGLAQAPHQIHVASLWQFALGIYHQHLQQHTYHPRPDSQVEILVIKPLRPDAWTTFQLRRDPPQHYLLCPLKPVLLLPSPELISSNLNWLATNRGAVLPYRSRSQLVHRSATDSQLHDSTIDLCTATTMTNLVWIW